MNNLLATLLTILFVASFIPLSSAQETKEPAQEPPPSSSEARKDQSKGEVDLALEELKKHGKGVLTACGEKCKNPKDAITGGAINGRAVKLVQPAYPAIARAAHVSGEVVVLAIIDKEGKVMAAQVVDGHPLLRVAALKAAKASRFTPTLLEKKPVNVMGEIVYHFVAMDR